MYVGATPTTGDFKILDSITTSSATTFNLRQGGVAVYPQSANHCLVVLNGVLQTAGSSFNIVNDTIVFASSLASSDVINQILVLGNVNDIGVPSDDTVSTAKIQANAVTAAKFNADVISGQTALGATPADTDELLVSDAGVLKRVDYSYLKGGDNNPSFMVVKTSSQSVTNNSATKVTWDSELKDSDSAFASDKFTVPSGKGGDYYIFATLEADAKNNSDLKVSYLKLYKNGSLLQQNVKDYRANQPRRQAQTLVGIHTLSASDYLELYSQIDSDDGDIEVNAYQASDGYGTIFGGFKLIT